MIAKAKKPVNLRGGERALDQEGEVEHGEERECVKDETKNMNCGERE